MNPRPTSVRLMRPTTADILGEIQVILVSVIILQSYKQK